MSTLESDEFANEEELLDETELAGIDLGEVDEDALLASDDEEEITFGETAAELHDQDDVLEIGADDEFDEFDTSQTETGQYTKADSSQYTDADTSQYSEAQGKTQDYAETDSFVENEQAEDDAHLEIDEIVNKSVTDDETDESDDDEDKEEGRGRFKTERIQIVTSSTSVNDIPDSLDKIKLDTKDQEEINKFTKPGRNNSFRDNNNRGNFRGRGARGHRPRFFGQQHNTRPQHSLLGAPIMDQSQQSARKFHVNPHFRRAVSEPRQAWQAPLLPDPRIRPEFRGHMASNQPWAGQYTQARMGQMHTHSQRPVVQQPMQTAGPLLNNQWTPQRPHVVPVSQHGPSAPRFQTAQSFPPQQQPQGPRVNFQPAFNQATIRPGLGPQNSPLLQNPVTRPTRSPLLGQIPGVPASFQQSGHRLMDQDERRFQRPPVSQMQPQNPRFEEPRHFSHGQFNQGPPMQQAPSQRSLLRQQIPAPTQPPRPRFDNGRFQPRGQHSQHNHQQHLTMHRGPPPQQQQQYHHQQQPHIQQRFHQNQQQHQLRPSMHHPQHHTQQEEMGQPIQTLVKRSPSGNITNNTPPRVNRANSNSNMIREQENTITAEEMEIERKKAARAARFACGKSLSVGTNKVQVGVKRPSPTTAVVAVKAKAPKIDTRAIHAKAANRSVQLAKARTIALNRKKANEAQLLANTANTQPKVELQKPSVIKSQSESMVGDVDQAYLLKLEEQKRMRAEILARKERNRLMKAEKKQDSHTDSQTQAAPIQTIGSTGEGDASQTRLQHASVQGNLQSVGRGSVRGRGGINTGRERGATMTRGGATVGRGANMGRGGNVIGRGGATVGRGGNIMGSGPVVNRGGGNIAVRGMGRGAIPRGMQRPNPQTNRQVTPPSAPPQNTIGSRIVLTNHDETPQHNLQHNPVPQQHQQQPARTVQLPRGGMVGRGRGIPAQGRGGVITNTEEPRRVVMNSDPPPPVAKPQGPRNVMMEGITQNTTVPELHRFASQGGRVESIRFIKELSKAVITYSNPVDAANAIKLLSRKLLNMAVIKTYRVADSKPRQ